jgi:signal transduction histidine kinase
MKHFLSVILIILSFSSSANDLEKDTEARVKQAQAYIEEHGKEQAILEFNKPTSKIFVIDYNGVFLASSIYPDLVGTNQFNFKDPSGVLVVQQEIELAKLGGGWLKGRWRIDPNTQEYGCRKIYVLPMPGDYLIGSWYFQPLDIKVSQDGQMKICNNL